MNARSRRDFLKAGGLLVGFSISGTAVSPELFAADTAAAPNPGRLDSWLHIAPDDTIRVFTGKVDIGMGVQTALMQVVAEELDVAPARLQIVMGDTATTPDQGGVGGSTSISAGAKPLRNAAAAARAALLQLASVRLGAPADRLVVADGKVSVKDDPSKSISYGALAAGEDLKQALRVSGGGFALNVEGNAKPKDPSTYSVVGQSVPRVDLAPKILGEAVYSTDIRIPGMVHGRVIRPAAAGAEFVSLDESAAKKVPGYLKAVVKGNFVGVIAKSEWAAVSASRDLKVSWTTPAPSFPSDLFAHLRTAKPRVSRQFQQVGQPLSPDHPGIIQAGYEWPFQAHATMGPGCAVADVQPSGVTTIWTGAQKPHALCKGLAQLLGVPEDRVRVIWVEAAGSYGRAGDEDVAADAALLSQALGKPVRVQWSRADMTAWGGKGPAAVIDIRAALDSSGKITALEMESRAFSGTEIIPQATTAGNLLAGQLTGAPNPTAGDEYVQWGGSTFPYTIPNLRCVGHVIPALWPSASPLRTTHLRDPNGPAGTFATESFIDELAARAGADPIEFRLRHTSDPRAKAVLEAAADRAGWSTRRPGLGVALALRGGTYVATIAEVEVDRSTGAVRVKRLVCAHDCGLIVNPAALRGTIQANLVQSMSRALKEEVTFDDKNVTSVDWKTYPVARWSDIPKVEVILINRPDLAPSGAGEPSSRPTAAAIHNAIASATGARVRRAPMTPARVLAAL